MCYSQPVCVLISCSFSCASWKGGPGSRQDGERCADPGGETPRQERLHEEIQGGPQSERRRMEHGQRGKQHQDQGWLTKMHKSKQLSTHLTTFFATGQGGI